VPRALLSGQLKHAPNRWQGICGQAWAAPTVHPLGVGLFCVAKRRSGGCEPASLRASSGTTGCDWTKFFAPSVAFTAASRGSADTPTIRSSRRAGQPTAHGARRAQMRWKTSIPRTLATRPFGATYEATPLVTMVVRLTKRPDQTVVALQSVVQFLDVWNTTRGPRTRPARSYGTPGQVPAGPLTKTPVKFPVAVSTAKTFSRTPR
jgi:hypothetical protein